MKEILTITKRLKVNMETEVRLFKAGVSYANKEKLKKLQSINEISCILDNLNINPERAYVCYWKQGNFEKVEGRSLLEMKTCIDVFIEELSAVLRKKRNIKGISELLATLNSEIVEMKIQWK